MKLCVRSHKGHVLGASRSSKFSRRVVTVRAGQDVELLSIPLFPLTSVLHPTQSGSVRVFEPRYLALFREQQEQAKQGQGEIRFGHILAKTACPPALLDDSVKGLPKLGVCAAVKAVQELPDGTLLVDYEGSRRFKLLYVDEEEKPYLVGAAEWYDDDVSSLTPAERSNLDQLEQQVMRALSDVASATAKLTSGSSSSSSEDASSSTEGSSSDLPAAVYKYSPPPLVKKTIAEYLDEAGSPAGQKIATWQRMGSVYGTAAKQKKPQHDPYQAMREVMGKDQRQELFSFAAASVLEMGVPERLALLSSQDTAARLQYVLMAIQPHLQELQARVSVKKAIGS